MSHIFDLFNRVEKAGVRLELLGNHLKINVTTGGDLPPGLLAELKERKEEIIAFLVRQVDEEAIPVQEKREYYPLSSTQKRLYILQQLDRQATVYNVPLFISLEKDIDKDRLSGAFNQLLARHEALRTSFISLDGEPVQRVLERVGFELEVFRAAGQGGRSGRGGQELIENIIRGFIRPFDLGRAPLMRVGLVEEAGRCLLMVDIHHIITDAASMNILVKDFTAFFHGEKLPPLKLHYKDFAAWQQGPVYREMLKPQERFWLDHLSGELPVLGLPLDFARPEVQSFAGNAIGFILMGEDGQQFRNMAQSLGVTPFMLGLAIFSLLLAKLSGQEDIVIGTPIAARRHADLEAIIGMFVNTLALRHSPAGDKIFHDYILEVKDRTLNAYENQEFPFEDLVEKLAVNRDTGRNPIFDVMFGFLEQTGMELEIAGKEPEGGNTYENKTAKFDLNLACSDLGDRLTFNLEYCTRLFKEGTIRRFIGYLQKMIHDLPVNGRKRLADIDILSEEEKHLLLVTFNGTGADYPLEKTVHRLFEEQAGRTPGNIAVVGPLTAASNWQAHTLSYGRLNERANRLAHYLRGKGVGPDTIVGLMARRSLEMIVGMLAILKAGAAYLPIDVDYPADRKSFMIEDSGLKIILSNFENEAAVKITTGVEVLNLEAEDLYPANTHNPKPINRSSDLVYLIYTSGSTGRPKGVMLEHINLVNLLLFGFQCTNLDFSSVLQFSTVNFDMSFHEIFSALLSGGKICLITEETRTDIPVLFRVIEANQVKTLFLPTAFLKALFAEEAHIAMFPACVRHIQTAGEQVVVSNRFRGFLKERGVHLHNHYGPAETHVVTVLTMNPAGDIPGMPTIGKPVANTAIYILDKYGNIRPLGVAGELHIGGVQVGRGYLNRPELTAERFITSPPSPLSKSGEGENSGSTAPDVRLYKTGDLCRWLDDGNIEFLGRIDFQVKIRGFRIEPGEIETQLMNHQGIKEAVVLVRTDGEGEKYLCAYIVPVDPGPGAIDHASLAAGWRDFLAEKLPAYMIPAHFVCLDRLPLTPNGKIDRRALPEPGKKAGQSYVAPRDTIEEWFVSQWSKILGIKSEEIGIDDDFFRLGGHSLKATTLMARIRGEFHLEFPLVEIFKGPTIRKLASIVQAIGKPDRKNDGAQDDLEEFTL